MPAGSWPRISVSPINNPPPKTHHESCPEANAKEMLHATFRLRSGRRRCHWWAVLSRSLAPGSARSHRLSRFFRRAVNFYAVQVVITQLPPAQPALRRMHSLSSVAVEALPCLHICGVRLNTTQKDSWHRMCWAAKVIPQISVLTSATNPD